MVMMMMMDANRRAERDAYESMSHEHLCTLLRHRAVLRQGPGAGRLSASREHHFVARLEWFICVNRVLELSLPGTRFKLGEELEHYNDHRLGI